MKKIKHAARMGLFSVVLMTAVSVAMFTFNKEGTVISKAEASVSVQNGSLVPREPVIDLDYIFSQVAKKYTSKNNPCNLAAVGVYYDTTLQGLTAESVKLAFNQAVKEQEPLGSLGEKRAARNLLKGTSVLNISEHQIRDYIADHRPGDINFIVKGCRL